MCSMDHDGFCDLWIGSSRHENNDEPFFKKHPGKNKKLSTDDQIEDKGKRRKDGARAR